MKSIFWFDVARTLAFRSQNISDSLCIHAPLSRRVDEARVLLGSKAVQVWPSLDTINTEADGPLYCGRSHVVISLSRATNAAAVRNAVGGSWHWLRRRRGGS